MTEDRVSAPELAVVEWLNSDPLTLADLRGRVVVLEAAGCSAARIATLLAGS